MSDPDWNWLLTRKDEVAGMSAEAATEVVDAGVTAHDPRLGAEVSDSGGTRQVLVTAGGDADAFAVVHRLVAAAPSWAGWSFIALRPGQGFDFDVDAGGMMFAAKALSFQPLSAEQAPSQLAIRLLVPNPQLPEWAEIGLQVIEAGVGEEAAARIAYLEIGKRDADADDVYALESLPGYIERHG